MWCRPASLCRSASASASDAVPWRPLLSRLFPPLAPTDDPGRASAKCKAENQAKGRSCLVLLSSSAAKTRRLQTRPDQWRNERHHTTPATATACAFCPPVRLSLRPPTRPSLIPLSSSARWARSSTSARVPTGRKRAQMRSTFSQHDTRHAHRGQSNGAARRPPVHLRRTSMDGKPAPAPNALALHAERVREPERARTSACTADGHRRRGNGRARPAGGLPRIRARAGEARLRQGTVPSGLTLRISSSGSLRKICLLTRARTLAQL